MSKTATYALIASNTVGTATSTVTFSSIPGTYTDLILIYSGAGSGSADLYMQFNGDTGNNYSRTYVFGDGSSAASSRQTSTYGIFWGYQTTGIQNASVNIMDYSNSTTNKTTVGVEAIPSVAIAAITGLWRNTAAITSVLVGAAGATFSTGTTLKLYGIQAGNA
jgi:hypothetical protein